MNSKPSLAAASKKGMLLKTKVNKAAVSKVEMNN
jgi:hypothetical protein